MKTDAIAQLAQLVKLGSSSVIFLPAGFIPPFPKGNGGEELGLAFRNLTKEEVREGEARGVRTPWAYRALTSTCDVWAAAHVTHHTTSGFWATSIAHIREGRPGYHPQLLRDVPHEERPRVAPSTLGALRRRLKELGTQRREMVMDTIDNTIVFSGETVMSVTWERDEAERARARKVYFVFCVAEDIVENVSRLRTHAPRAYDQSRPRNYDHVRPTGRTVELQAAASAAPANDKPIGVVEPVTKKVTVEEKGGWGTGRAIMPMLIVPKAMAPSLPAPAPESDDSAAIDVEAVQVEAAIEVTAGVAPLVEAPVKALRKKAAAAPKAKRETPKAPRAAKKPKLATAGSAPPEEEGSDLHLLPDDSPFKALDALDLK